MTLKGADLVVWAQQQAEREADAPYPSTVLMLQNVIAKAYLRGAIDALDEERQDILDAARVGWLEVGP